MLFRSFGKGGRATWRIYTNGTPKEARADLAWSSFATPFLRDPNTYGFRWNSSLVKATNSPNGPVVLLPEYYQLKTNAQQKAEWVPVRAEDVPAETGLAAVRFPHGRERSPEPYVTPDGAQTCWKQPGPKVTFSSPVGRWERGHLLLVSFRRPAGLAERRLVGRRAGSPAGARGENSPPLETRPGLPATSGAGKTGGFGSGLGGDPAARLGGGICSDCHPASRERISPAVMRIIAAIA